MKKTSFFLLLMFFASVCTISLNAKAETRIFQSENRAHGLNYHVSDETRGLLKQMDQQYCFFKIVAGGKYPYLLSFHPGKNEIKSVLCGTYNAKTNDIELIKKTEQIKTMKPMRVLTLMVDGNLKMDEKYRRETFLGQVVEDLFKTLKILPNKEYNGIVLFDEFMNGVPMKLVLRDIQDFRAVKEYLLNNLNDLGLTQVRKPVLVLEFEKTNTAFNADDISFLNTYFELADPADMEVKAFFKSGQEYIGEAMRYFGGALKVGDKFGDLLINQLEKPYDGFKSEVIAMIVLSTVGGMLLGELKDVVKLDKDGLLKDIKNSLKNIIKDVSVPQLITATGLTTFGVYCVFKLLEEGKQADDVEMLSKKDYKSEHEDTAEEVAA